MENKEEEKQRDNSLDVIEEISNTSTTNCLALTIQEEHKLQALKNVFSTSMRISWKVAISTIVLSILKLFS